MGGASASCHFGTSDMLSAYYDESPGHNWITVQDTDRRIAVHLHGTTAEDMVTVIVAALPSDRREALIRTLGWPTA